MSHGRSDCWAQVLLPEVMKIYSSQLTSLCKVLSGCIFLWFPPDVDLLGWFDLFFSFSFAAETEWFIQMMKSCPIIFYIQIHI